MSSSEQIIADFKEYQQMWRTWCEEGKCTKAEATAAILTRAMEIIEGLKLPEQENLYQARMVN